MSCCLVLKRIDLHVWGWSIDLLAITLLIKLLYVLVDCVNLMRGLLHWLMNWVHLWIYEWTGWVDWDLLEGFMKWTWLGLVRYIKLLVNAMIKWADQLGWLIQCDGRINEITSRWVGALICLSTSQSPLDWLCAALT